MKTTKKKILVLSDLNRSTKATLKSAVSLAKMMDGKIEFFYVKKPTDLVKTDNQFSALRSMKDEYVNTESEIKELIGSISKDFGIKIGHRIAFGNVKSEIEKYLNTHKPDVIVLGKRSTKPFQFTGNGITEFVMDYFDGNVLVAAEENALLPNHPIAMGWLNGAKPSSSLGFSKEVMENSVKPIKTFKIIENSKLELSTPVSTPADTVEFVFEKDENSVKNLSKYLLKNSINLLCVERNPSENTHFVDIVGSDLKKNLSKLKVSVLFQGKQNYAVS